MTKLYKITPTEDYGVIVDTYRMMAKHGEYSLTSLGKARKVDDSPVLWQNGCHPIIATFGKRLDGVPFIELVDAVEQLWETFIKSDINNGSASSYHEWLKLNNGYKANTNKYSEEDMRLAYDDALIEGKNCPNNGYEDRKYLTDKYIQSIKKLPIPTEVELETEIINTPISFVFDEIDMMMEEEIIKIHNKETNTITAVNYK